MKRAAKQIHGFKGQALILPGEFGWIVQGVHRDICAQGATLAEGVKSFERTVAGEIALSLEKGRVPTKRYPLNLPVAPRILRKIWAKAPTVHAGTYPVLLTINKQTFALTEEYRLCDANPLNLKAST